MTDGNSIQKDSSLLLCTSDGKIMERNIRLSIYRELMHDFLCSNLDDMFTPILATKARYLKTDPEGVDIMCKVMEDMRNEAIQRGIDQNRIESIKNVMESFKVDAQQAMDALKIPVADQPKYLNRL